MIATAPSKPQTSQPRRSRLAIFASVRMTVALLVAIATTVLLGAWCPQESQVGQDKVVEQFGPEMALTLHNLGITDIFHTPWFLLLIGLLTVNMVACSMQRVFPKVHSLKLAMPYLSGEAIEKLPLAEKLALCLSPPRALDMLEQRLVRCGYKSRRNGNALVAEFGKFGRLAPTITHIGLLTLLAGVTITSWTGFSGFQPIPVGGSLEFGSSEHSRLWIGKLPEWRVTVDASRREDYETGEPKQWYSDLTVIDGGVPVKRQQISVNNPLSYKGVDIYQSSWDLDSIVLRFNGRERRFELRQMGKVHAAFLPLEAETVLIFSIRNQQQPLRVFAKTPQWEAPRLLTEVAAGKSARLGSVELTYVGVIPVTGLQYKCDPGLPITYIAFGFIITGVLLASVPHRQVWAYAEETGSPSRSAPNGNGNGATDGRVDLVPVASRQADLATIAIAAGPADSTPPAVGQPESVSPESVLESAVSPPAAPRPTDIAALAPVHGQLDEFPTATPAIGCTLCVGGRSLKARTAFERGLRKVVDSMKAEAGELA